MQLRGGFRSVGDRLFCVPRPLEVGAVGASTGWSAPDRSDLPSGHPKALLVRLSEPWSHCLRDVTVTYLGVYRTLPMGWTL